MPPDLEPYMGRNGLAHLLTHPHEAEEQGNNLPLQNGWLQRFPKKEKTKLTVCPPYQYGPGWGVELEEGWYMIKLIGLISALFLLAAIIFTICWWVLKDDLQGASGMAAFLVSVATAIIGLLSAIALT